MLAAIDIVAKEEIVGGWWVAAGVEEAEEVRELAVQVADDLNGGVQFEQDGLREKDVPCRGADADDFGVAETDTLGWFGRPGEQESSNGIVEID